MFNALKKLTGKGGGGGEGPSPLLSTTGPPPLSHTLQKKFAKGVHYNMKIVIKGDRNVGKSALFKRLQGQPFVEEYTATEEIQVGTITWNYKNREDIVKVEIWDVVDVAQKKKKLDKLKLDNSEEFTEFGLDANTIDVFKNTHGVMLVFDITKNWSWDYVKREVPKLPGHLPILIVGNRRDMGHHRSIAEDTVLYFIEGLEEREGQVRYAESSMRYGFGLKFIHKFFNLPYLTLQKESLLKQIEINKQESEITLQELDLYGESDDANYELFIDKLSKKRREVADAMGPPKLSLVEAQAVANAKALKDAKDEKEAAIAAARLAIKSDPTAINTSSPGIKKTSQNPAPTKSSGAVTSVDDFVVDEDLGGFLEDGVDDAPSQNGAFIQDASSSDDDEGGNPMVARTQEDIEVFGIIRNEITSTTTNSVPKRFSDNEEMQTKIFDKPGFQLFVGDHDHAEDGAKEHDHEQSKKPKHKKKHKRKHKKSTSSGGGLEEFLGGGDAIPTADVSTYEQI